MPRRLRNGKSVRVGATNEPVWGEQHEAAAPSPTSGQPADLCLGYVHASRAEWGGDLLGAWPEHFDFTVRST
jgi:hypothetical protein